MPRVPAETARMARTGLHFSAHNEKCRILGTARFKPNGTEGRRDHHKPHNTCTKTGLEGVSRGVPRRRGAVTQAGPGPGPARTDAANFGRTGVAAGRGRILS